MDESGRSLFYACYFQHVDKVKELLAISLDPNQCYPLEFQRKPTLNDEDTAGSNSTSTTSSDNDDSDDDDGDDDDDGHQGVYLHNEAAEEGYYKRLFNVEKPPDPLLRLEKRGRTPLSMSCYHGNTEIVELLLNDPRVDVNKQKQSTGSTPFSTACFFGHLHVVRLFLNHPLAEISRSNKSGCSPLWMAAQNGHAHVGKAILRFIRKLEQTREGNAGYSGGKAISNPDAFITISALVNQQELEEGTSPLWMTAQEGHVDFIRMMLQFPEVEVNLADHDNCTPLWVSARKGKLSVVKMLMALREDLDEGVTANAGTNSWNLTNSREQALIFGHFDVCNLIDRWAKERHVLRKQLLSELGISEEHACYLFLFVILLNDDYLRFRHTTSTDPKILKTLKFFSIVERFSMDIQMVVCNRVYGLSTDIITTAKFENVLKDFFSYE